MQGIDPWSLPCYRFYNLIIYRWTDGIDAESIKALEIQLERTDEIVSPFQSTVTTSAPTSRPGTTKRRPSEEKSTKVTGHISKPAAPSQGEDAYIPPWWKGDDANYQTAKKVMMSPLPKMG